MQAPSPEAIRSQLLKLIESDQQLSDSPGEEEVALTVLAMPMVETHLVRDGWFCGRKYQIHGFRAIWFAEENKVKFFSPSEGVVYVCEANELSEGSTIAVPTSIVTQDPSKLAITSHRRAA